MNTQKNEIVRQLCSAIQNGELAQIVSLLNSNISVDVIVNSEGDTPLLLATAHNQSAIVESLLTNGANVDAKNQGGFTALMYAVIYGHSSIVSLLLQHGANKDLKAHNGCSAFIFASYLGNKKISDLFLRIKGLFKHEIDAINTELNSTSEHRASLFNEIKKQVGIQLKELDRLHDGYLQLNTERIISVNWQALMIREAIARLEFALEIKRKTERVAAYTGEHEYLIPYDIQYDSKLILPPVFNTANIINTRFSSCEDMLNAHIEIWEDLDDVGCEACHPEQFNGFHYRCSLRDALNISRDNVFYNYMYRSDKYRERMFGPLFGKTKYLCEVEKALSNYINVDQAEKPIQKTIMRSSTLYIQSSLVSSSVVTPQIYSTTTTRLTDLTWRDVNCTPPNNDLTDMEAILLDEDEEMKEDRSPRTTRQR